MVLTRRVCHRYTARTRCCRLFATSSTRAPSSSLSHARPSSLSTTDIDALLKHARSDRQSVAAEAEELERLKARLSAVLAQNSARASLPLTHRVREKLRANDLGWKLFSLALAVCSLAASMELVRATRASSAAIREASKSASLAAEQLEPVRHARRKLVSDLDLLVQRIGATEPVAPIESQWLTALAEAFYAADARAEPVAVDQQRARVQSLQSRLESLDTAAK